MGHVPMYPLFPIHHCVCVCVARMSYNNGTEWLTRLRDNGTTVCDDENIIFF